MACESAWIQDSQRTKTFTVAVTTEIVFRTKSCGNFLLQHVFVVKFVDLAGYSATGLMYQDLSDRSPQNSVDWFHQ